MTNFTTEQLEQVYDSLAQAIDQSETQDKTELFLSKLCLLCAKEIASAERFEALIDIALKDL